MRSTRRIENIVLPELSLDKPNNGIYNTQNRYASKQLHLNHVVLERPKGGINLYIEFEKQARSDSCEENKDVSREKYSFIEVGLLRLRRIPNEDKYGIHDKNLPTVLANSSNHSRARRHNIECN